MLYYREISEENFNTHLREMVGVVTAGEGLVTFIGFHKRYGQHVLLKGEGKFGLVEPDINPETILKDAEDAREAFEAVEADPKEKEAAASANPSDRWTEAAWRLEWAMSFIRGDLTAAQRKRQNALEAFCREQDLAGVRWISAPR